MSRKMSLNLYVAALNSDSFFDERSAGLLTAL